MRRKERANLSKGESLNIGCQWGPAGGKKVNGFFSRGKEGAGELQISFGGGKGKNNSSLDDSERHHSLLEPESRDN